jgi:hypothetical protein
MQKTIGDIPYQFHFEREQGLGNAEGRAERAAESGAGISEEEANAIARQKAALFNLKNRDWINSLYGNEINDGILKDHFDIHYFGDYTEEEKTSFKLKQEYDLNVICGYLESDFPKKKISMYVYKTAKAKKEADPNHSVSRASFRSQEFRIYRVWGEEMPDPSFPHETVHAITHTWTTPYQWSLTVDTYDGKEQQISIPMESTSFMQEGLAITVEELAFGRKLREKDELMFPDEYIKKYLQQNVDLPLIKDLVLFDGFCDHDAVIVVPMAASFTKFLIENFKLALFKKFYLVITENMTTEEIDKHAFKIFGENLVNLQKKWISGLK